MTSVFPAVSVRRGGIRYDVVVIPVPAPIAMQLPGVDTDWWQMEPPRRLTVPIEPVGRSYRPRHRRD